MKTKTAKFVVIHREGGYLHRFNMAWYNNFQDDPSCWTDDRAQAHSYTTAQIEKMRSMLVTFQGDFTTEEIS